MYEKIGQSIFVIPALIAMSLGSLGLRPSPPETKQPTATPIAVESAEPSSTPSAEPSLNELIEKYFPEKAWKQAKKIVECESGGNSQSIGDGHLKFQKDGKTYGASYGYFQVRYLVGRPDPDWLLNPENNVKYAAQLYSWAGDSWKDWSCRRVL